MVILILVVIVSIGQFLIFNLMLSSVSNDLNVSREKGAIR